MRQLHACDFCGADPAGVYEVVPESEANPDPGPEPLAEPAPEPSAEAAEADEAPETDTDARPSDSEREAARREAMRTAPRADRPRGYEKVMRLLGNRDGAMPRNDLETLVTNAYGLDARGFDAVVEAALENGDLEEGKRGLRTT